MPAGSFPTRPAPFRLTLAALAFLVPFAAIPLPALALSELRELPAQTPAEPAPAGGIEGAPHDDMVLPPGQQESHDDEEPAAPFGLPDPDPLVNRAPAETAAPQIPDTAETDDTVILHDIAEAPEPVRRMRQLIIEAAASADIARLKPLMNPGPDQTELSLGGTEGDILEVLRGFSGDDDGIEILAILLDILSAGFAHVDPGGPHEVYVWPYFAEKPLAELTPAEKVELMRIITAGDYDGMLEYGNYNFFRMGITPDGRWKFLLAGD